MIIPGGVLQKAIRELDKERKISLFYHELNFQIHTIDTYAVALGNQDGDPNDWIIIFTHCGNDDGRLGICNIQDVIESDNLSKIRVDRFPSYLNEIAEDLFNHLESLISGMNSFPMLSPYINHRHVRRHGCRIVVATLFKFYVIDTEPFYILCNMVVNTVHIRKDNGPWPIGRDSYYDMEIVTKE